MRLDILQNFHCSFGSRLICSTDTGKTLEQLSPSSMQTWRSQIRYFTFQICHSQISPTKQCNNLRSTFADTEAPQVSLLWSAKTDLHLSSISTTNKNGEVPGTALEWTDKSRWWRLSSWIIFCLCHAGHWFYNIARLLFEGMQHSTFYCGSSFKIGIQGRDEGEFSSYFF